MEMMYICIAAGVVILAGCLTGLCLFLKKRKKKGRAHAALSPPPAGTAASASVSAGVGEAVSHPPRTHTARRAMPKRIRGPKGIRPDQFPCCPIDKQRNVAGSPQKVFWDSGSKTYYCSRGHHFQKNGKPL